MSGKLSVCVGVLAAGVLGSLWAIMSLIYRHQKRRPPSEWTKAGTVTQVMLYPVKSCKGEVLEEARCTPMGLEHDDAKDRIFTVVDAKNKCVGLTGYPEIALISPYCSEQELRLDAPGMPTLSVPLPLSIDEVDEGRIVTDIKLHSAVVSRAVDCGDAAAEWLSTYLKKGIADLRLLYHIEKKSTRQISPKRLSVADNLTERGTGAFSDNVSYMVLTEDSLKDLNGRLRQDVSALNFRPNILIESGTPYAENEWLWIKIGDVIFRAVMPCTRCIKTTVDPDTGLKDADMEPLRTLKTYRQVTEPTLRAVVGESPAFGAYFQIHSICSDDTVIRAGDEVFVGY